MDSTPRRAVPVRDPLTGRFRSAAASDGTGGEERESEDNENEPGTPKSESTDDDPPSKLNDRRMSIKLWNGDKYDYEMDAEAHVEGVKGMVTLNPGLRDPPATPGIHRGH